MGDHAIVVNGWPRRRYSGLLAPHVARSNGREIRTLGTSQTHRCTTGPCGLLGFAIPSRVG